MRPRRPFRRNTLRRIPPIPAGRIVPPQLVDANQLFLAERYVPAGERYASLAAGAEERLLPQAALLYLQATRAFLLAHHPERAEQLAQQGLHLLYSQGRLAQLERMGPRVVWEFEHQGHKVEAERLAAWLRGVLPERLEKPGGPVRVSEQPAGDVRQTERNGLPRLCPSCGAPIDPRDVEWADEKTPLCAFCSSPLIESE